MSDSSAAVPSTVPSQPFHESRLLPLTLTALGVVYGDIGTSVLYALRECFFGSHAVPPTHENVLGVLSLIIWALLLVVSIKYVALVLRADNQGEGGILALTALVPGRGTAAEKTGSRLAVGRPVLIALGIFGTALLYGDGMITPAISVLSAVEGLEVATPLFSAYVVPATVAILIGLGTWQLQRMAWKEDLIAQIQARAYGEPGAILPELEWASWRADRDEFRKVRVTGTPEAAVIGQDRTGITFDVRTLVQVQDWSW